jgi:hypothetical protein
LREKGEKGWLFFDQGNKYAIWRGNGVPRRSVVHRVIHSFCG